MEVRNINYLKKELEIIEEKEGAKGDDYCKYIYPYLFVSPHKEQLAGFLKDFMVDYSPKDARLAREFYKDLCNLILDKLNDKSNNEHAYWFDNYVKYKTLEIEHAKELGRKEIESGYYHLGLVYSVEYTNTGNEDYYKKAKHLLSEVKGELYLLAQEELSKLRD